MNPSPFEVCRAYLEAHSHPHRSETPRHLPALTLSRETGTGALALAEQVIRVLEARNAVGPEPWAMFDRNLVERVLMDHGLHAHLARFMPEDVPSGIRDAVEEVLNVHPSSWSLLQHTSPSILRIARMGHAILIGRGAHLITSHLRHVLHVRLVASPDYRIRKIEKSHHLSRDDAARHVRKTDRARRRYVLRHFYADVASPLDYHLVLNIERLGREACAALVVEGLLGLQAQKTVAAAPQVAVS